MEQPLAVRKVKKRFWSFLINRLTITAFLLLLQFVVTIAILLQLQGRFSYVFTLAQLLSIFIVIWLVRKNDNPAYKMPWIIVILVFPALGTIFYLFWGNTPFNQARLVRIPPLCSYPITQYNKPANRTLCTRLPRHRRLCQYLNSMAEMPAWQNTATEFYPLGDYQFEAMLVDLKKAKKFIFLEYFIIEPGIVWNSILDILVEKTQQGVDVRVMYDDAGCLATLPIHYDRKLASMGIQAVKFNQFVPLMNTYLNYRDHRKLCIIDGNIGFTGGINLADEYINQKVRFGHWKDTGVRLCGEGVLNMTMQFLQLWDFSTKTRTANFEPYLPTISADTDGYVQPFSDSPLDNNNIGEMVFMNIINNASRYVYITTPYLTLDNEMITALCTAAQSGIDVRIVTSGIPDKKYVYAVTRSYYAQLMRAGVQIYEYTPGFLHAKMIVSDNDVAVVGTINMDFRSFYLHFECGTVFYRSSVVDKVKEDILDTISKSRQIDSAWIDSYPWIKSIYSSIMRLFAPLL